MKYIFVILIIMSFFLFIIIKNKKYPIILLLLTTLSMMLGYPSVSLDAAKEGINLWLFVVIPSLIPFFIINDMLIFLRVPDNIARLFSPAAKVLFGTSGYGAYVFIMSIFSGYPAGARITSQLIENRKITPQEGSQILTFSSTSGPLFIIGAVGSGMLKSTLAGYILFLSHFVGAVANGIILRFFFPKNRNYNPVPKQNSNTIPSVGDMLSKAISNTLVTCGFIGGYIILFSVVIALLNTIDFFSMLQIFMSKFLFIPPVFSGHISSLFETSIEISNGCRIISMLNTTFDIKLIMSSFIIAFSGLSIIGQAVSLINKTGISIKGYFISKIFHGFFAAISCAIIIKLSSSSLETFAFFRSLEYINLPFIIVLLLIIILALNILSSRIISKKNRVL